MIEFDRSILGKEFVLGTFQVTEEMMMAFAQAVGETSPQYTDPEGAKFGYLLPGVRLQAAF